MVSNSLSEKVKRLEQKCPGEIFPGVTHGLDYGPYSWFSRLLSHPQELAQSTFQGFLHLLIP